MPKFMALHTFPPGAFTNEQVHALAQAGQQDPVVRGYRSFVNLSEGKAVCITEGPSADAVAGWFDQMGMPCDGVFPVKLEGERGQVQEA